MSYFGNIWDAIKTTAKGLSITTGYLRTTKKFTINYPDERLDIDETTHRGIHEYDVDRCISCKLCAKACPVDCIYIESEGKGKEALMTRFDIDYSKCLFCALCVPPCPSECIQLGSTYSLPGHSRDDMIVQFHKGGHPIKQLTENAKKQILEYEEEGLFDKKLPLREALGVPTMAPQNRADRVRDGK